MVRATIKQEKKEEGKNGNTQADHDSLSRDSYVSGTGHSSHSRGDGVTGHNFKTRTDRGICDLGTPTDDPIMLSDNGWEDRIVVYAPWDLHTENKSLARVRVQGHFGSGRAVGVLKKCQFTN